MECGESSYRRYLAGDETALDEILTLYRIPLTFFIDRIVHDPDTAEDIAIDVFADLLANPKRYDFRASLKTYLFLRGRSLALSYLRRRKFLSPDPIPENYPAEQDLEAEYLANEEKRILHRALNALPPDMQQALHLVYFEDLSYEQTAKVMKKSKKQVDNLLYRGKERLRTTLRKEGMEL